MNTYLPRFRTPEEVIDFIKNCVEASDVEGLSGACLEEIPDFWKEYIFQDFIDIQQSETLAAVFLMDGEITALPEDVNLLKLGGHADRTRYLHIDLEKSGDEWLILRIFKCR